MLLLLPAGCTCICCSFLPLFASFVARGIVDGKMGEMHKSFGKQVLAKKAKAKALAAASTAILPSTRTSAHTHTHAHTHPHTKADTHTYVHTWCPRQGCQNKTQKKKKTNQSRADECFHTIQLRLSSIPKGVTFYLCTLRLIINK